MTDPQNAREQSGSKRKADVDPLSTPDSKRLATPKRSPVDAPLEIFTPNKLRPSLSLLETPKSTLLSALHAPKSSVPASPTALPLQATAEQPTTSLKETFFPAAKEERKNKEDLSFLPTTLLAAAHHLAQQHEDTQHAAHAVQAIAARHIAERLLAAVEKKRGGAASKEPAGAPSHAADFSPCPRPTAGVSYVVKSESRQIGAASGTLQLPHLTYRPPTAPQEALLVSDPRVAATVRTLMVSPTLVTVLPLKDEGAMKIYVLEAATRHAQLQAAGGLTRVVGGATELPPLLQDRLFVCLHYRIKKASGGSSNGGFSVLPCLSQAINGGEGSAEAVPAALESSNLQLGVIIKKGVGGTWPLRCAARRLQGALGLLMDDAGSAVHHAMPSDVEGTDGFGLDSCPAAAEAAATQPAHQRLSLNTASCRLELYVDREMWQSLDRENQSVLHSVISTVEAQLSQLCEQLNWERLLGFCRSMGSSGAGAAHRPLSSPLAAQLEPLIDREIHEELGFGGSQVEAQPASSAKDEDGATGEKGVSFAAAFVLAAGCAASLGLGGASAAQVPWPQYLIGTRDHFSHHLLAVDTVIKKEAGGNRRLSFTKTEWFFKPGEAPADYHDVVHRYAAGAARQAKQAEQQGADAAAAGAGEAADSTTEAVEASPLLPAGVTTYTDIFSAAELHAIEAHCDELHSKRSLLPPACQHSTFGRGGGLKRTKYFFGARYLWTREQLSGVDAQVARGVRVDVPLPPAWVKAAVEAPLAEAGVLPPHSIDSVAINLYNDGSEGLQSHFDDSLRFQQPIHSLRLFSDSRIAFGTQLYGYNNGVFCIPMPRGCVTVMEAGGYAANGVKHCIRPVDMTGKSAGMILRRMQPVAMQQAKLHFIEETTEALSRLSFLHTAAPSQTLLSSAASSCRACVKAPPPSQEQQVAAVLSDLVTAVEEMEKRKALAEAAGLDVMARPDDAAVFSLVHGMVSYCEAVADPGLVRAAAEGRNRKPAVSQVAAARNGEGAVLGEVAVVMQNMLRAVEAAELAEEWERQQTAAAGAAAGAAARLLALARAAAAAVLCGAAPAGVVSETETVAAVQAVLVGAQVESVHALKKVLLGAGEENEVEEGEIAVVKGSPAAQFQMAVGLCFRALCVAASSSASAAAVC